MAPILTVKEGDEVQVDETNDERTTVKTPSCPQENPHNFGPASDRDATLFTCERPGGDPADKASKIPTQTVVDEWVAYMTASERQIKHVIILLGDSELEDYEAPGLISAYEAAGIVVHHIPMSSKDSFQRIMATIEDVESKDERAVVHCTHGMGRSGRVAAGVSSEWRPKGIPIGHNRFSRFQFLVKHQWVVHKHGISPEEATNECLEVARQHKVERLGAPRLLKDWMGL